MDPKSPLYRTTLAPLASAVSRHPRLILAASAVLTIASVAITLISLELRTGRNDLLSPDRPYNRRYLEFIREFSSMEAGVIVVDASDRDRAMAYAEDLAADLTPRLPAATRLSYKIDDGAFLRKAILLLPPERLGRISEGVEGAARLIRAVAGPRGLEELFDGLAERVRSAGEEDVPPEALPILSGLVRAASRSIDGEQTGPPLEGLGGLDGLVGVERRYHFSEDGRFLFMQINPYPENAPELSGTVRESMRRVGAGHPGLAAGLTGRPVLAHDEMETVSADMVVASLVSIVAVALLFVISFRSLLQPLLAVITLAVGIAWSFGAAALLVGHLNLLSVIFGVILIGLGIDFGIHLLARYQEERQRGSEPEAALTETMRHTGGGLLTGAVTMAAAFFATTIGTFQGIAEMGLITGVGMLLCLAAMLTVFPSLLILTDRGPPGGRPSRGSPPRVLAGLYRRPVPLLLVTLAVTSAAVVHAMGASFSYNLLELQVPDLESVRYERELLSGDGPSTWFCASLSGSLAEARERAARFEALPTVRKVEGLPALLPHHQEDRLREVSKMRDALSGIGSRAPPIPEIRPGRIRRAVEGFAKALEAAAEGAFEGGQAEAAEKISVLREDAMELAGRIGQGAEASAPLRGLQEALQEQVSGLVRTFLIHLPESPMTLSDIPKDLRDRFLGSEGHYLLLVYPSENIWGRERKERFLEEIRSVDPDVTGAPVQVYESTNIMRTGYRRAGISALIVVFIVILIDFRSLRSAILAMAPLLMGAVWMAGAMPTLGLEFNLGNLVVLPLILGIGVVDGVHIVHRYRERPAALVEILWGSTGKAVLLTSLTTIAGFGAIGIFSHHPGLSSLGFVLSLGVAACLLTSCFALPPLMQCFYGTARRASRDWPAPPDAP